MSKPIEDYALIGDCETAALVARDGSIDWLCWPRFDSPACLAALLGDTRNGCWRVAPEAEPRRITRRYRGDTLILDTEFETEAGTVRVTDFMPVRETASDVVRIVAGVRGRVPMRSELRLRFDYGDLAPWVEQRDGEVIATAGVELAILRAPAPLRVEDACGSIVAEFTVAEGQTVPFVLSYGSSLRGPPASFDPASALRDTEAFWGEWSGRFAHRGRWREPIMRSLVTLKALIHRPSGGVVAAATTSLPEQVGGAMNWDYRFCWLRDASFTLTALLNAGYLEEARQWRDWLDRAVAGSPEKLRIMYQPAGERWVEESEIPWLPGYEGSIPVRSGNGAAKQFQIDVYGELIDCMHIAVKAGLPRSRHGIGLETALIAHLETIWQEPDKGLWEVRGEAQHFTYSKVMAWVAVDRFLQGEHTRPQGDRLRELEGLRDRMHAEICDKGFDPGLNSFVQHYGTKALDASLLLLPLVGFLPVGDPRIRGTVEAVGRELTADGGLLLRNRPGPGQQQGAFLACSCWMADCLLLLGRRADAEALFERVLDLRNDVGLLSEEYDPERQRLAGNFPQALSHLALINTGLNLSDAASFRRGG